MARPLREQRPERAREDDARRGTTSPAAGAQGSAAGPLIHLATRCETIDEFVEKFASFVSENGLVVPSAGELAVGTEGRFVIRLKDQTPAMRGRCRVLEVRPGGPEPPGAGANSSAKRTLMRVELLEMDDDTREVHRRLMARRKPPPPPRPEPPAEVEASEPTMVSDERPSLRRSLPPAPPPLAVVPPPRLPVAPPPRSPTTSSGVAFAPTLVGIPARATAAMPAAAPPVPPAAPVVVATEAPTPGPTPGLTPGPVEARVPGADFTLPANPLSGLESNDLASFIECTLFEAGDSMGGPALEAGSAAAVEAAPAPQLESQGLLVGRRDKPEGPVRRWLARLPRPLRTVVIIAVPYAICTVIGVLVGNTLRSPPPPRTAGGAAHSAPAAAAASPAPVASAATHAPAPPPAPAVAPALAAAASPAPAPAAPAAAPAPAATPVAAPARGGPCTARIGTEPDEAEVFWGNKLLGRTPMEDVRVPCGPSTITMRHERYRSVSRPITAEPGTPAVISERLRRPPGTLVINSSPAHARVVVNDDVLGPAPQRTGTMRFEHVHVYVSLPGYLPYAKTIYLKEAVTKVNAQLVSAASPHRSSGSGTRATGGGVQRPSSTSRSGQ